MVMAPEIDLSDRSSSKRLRVYNLLKEKWKKKKEKGKQPHGWNKSIIKKANFTTMAGSASPFASVLSLMASTA